MIDASKIVEAHLAANVAPHRSADAAPDEPKSRQFPLAGVPNVRPLADPARRNPEGKA